MISETVRIQFEAEISNLRKEINEVSSLLKGLNQQVNIKVTGIDSRVVTYLRQLGQALQFLSQSGRAAATSSNDVVVTHRRMAQALASVHKTVSAATNSILRWAIQLSSAASSARQATTQVDRLRMAAYGLRSSLSGFRALDLFSAAVDRSSMYMWRFLIATIPLQRMAWSLAAGYTAATLAIGKLVQMGSEMEQIRLGFESLLGSAEAAERLLEKIREVARLTPYNIRDIAKAYRMVIASGLRPFANEVVMAATMIGASQTGQARNVARAVNALIDLYNRFPRRLRETYQIVPQMLQVQAEMLGENLRKSGQQISESSIRVVGAQNKIVNSSMAITSAVTLAFRWGMMAMTHYSDTIAGRWERVMDSLIGMADSLTQIVKPVLMDLMSILQWLIDRVRGFLDAIRATYEIPVLGRIFRVFNSALIFLAGVAIPGVLIGLTMLAAKFIYLAGFVGSFVMMFRRETWELAKAAVANDLVSDAIGQQNARMLDSNELMLSRIRITELAARELRFRIGSERELVAVTQNVNKLLALQSKIMEQKIGFAIRLTEAIQRLVAAEGELGSVSRITSDALRNQILTSAVATAASGGGARQVPHFQQGGVVPGPGAVPIIAHEGELVIPKRLAPFFAWIWRQLENGRIGAFQEGGPVMGGVGPRPLPDVSRNIILSIARQIEQELSTENYRFYMRGGDMGEWRRGGPPGVWISAHEQEQLMQLLHERANMAAGALSNVNQEMAGLTSALLQTATNTGTAATGIEGLAIRLRTLGEVALSEVGTPLVQEGAVNMGRMMGEMQRALGGLPKIWQIRLPGAASTLRQLGEAVPLLGRFLDKLRDSRIGNVINRITRGRLDTTHVETIIARDWAQAMAIARRRYGAVSPEALTGGRPLITQETVQRMLGGEMTASELARTMEEMGRARTLMGEQVRVLVDMARAYGVTIDAGTSLNQMLHELTVAQEHEEMLIAEGMRAISESGADAALVSERLAAAVARLGLEEEQAAVLIERALAQINLQQAAAAAGAAQAAGGGAGAGAAATSGAMIAAFMARVWGVLRGVLARIPEAVLAILGIQMASMLYHVVHDYIVKMLRGGKEEENERERLREQIKRQIDVMARLSIAYQDLAGIMKDVSTYFGTIGENGRFVPSTSKEAMPGVGMRISVDQRVIGLYASIAMLARHMSDFYVKAYMADSEIKKMTQESERLDMVLETANKLSKMGVSTYQAQLSILRTQFNLQSSVINKQLESAVLWARTGSAAELLSRAIAEIPERFEKYSKTAKNMADNNSKATKLSLDQMRNLARLEASISQIILKSAENASNAFEGAGKSLNEMIDLYNKYVDVLVEMRGIIRDLSTMPIAPYSTDMDTIASSTGQAADSMFKLRAGLSGAVTIINAIGSSFGKFDATRIDKILSEIGESTKTALQDIKAEYMTIANMTEEQRNSILTFADALEIADAQLSAGIPLTEAQALALSEMAAKADISRSATTQLSQALSQNAKALQAADKYVEQLASDYDKLSKAYQSLPLAAQIGLSGREQTPQGYAAAWANVYAGISSIGRAGTAATHSVSLHSTMVRRLSARLADLDDEINRLNRDMNQQNISQEEAARLGALLTDAIRKREAVARRLESAELALGNAYKEATDDVQRYVNSLADASARAASFVEVLMRQSGRVTSSQRQVLRDHLNMIETQAKMAAQSGNIAEYWSKVAESQEQGWKVATASNRARLSLLEAQARFLKSVTDIAPNAEDAITKINEKIAQQHIQMAMIARQRGEYKRFWEELTAAAEAYMNTVTDKDKLEAIINSIYKVEELHGQVWMERLGRDIFYRVAPSFISHHYVHWDDAFKNHEAASDFIERVLQNASEGLNRDVAKSLSWGM